VTYSSLPSFDGDYPTDPDGVLDLNHLTQMALEADDFDEHYGLVSPERLVVVRSYSDDSDDRVLTELQPRFIVMLEPNLDFVRRIEVYRGSNPGLAVRVYVQIWDTSAEEDMYLAELRREKEAFEHLIRERSVSTPILLHGCASESAQRVWFSYYKKNRMPHRLERML
jgi:DNA excision repair protein ERCC-4